MEGKGKLVSIGEAALRLGISKITCYRWAEAGTLPSTKLGARRLIAEATIDRLIAEATREGV
ncbi:MAG: helix-turn-helix domain-containing protein [Treponema sp.]|nr:helix-turn-helix domain-containing protein [Treponema sp.]